MIVRDGRGRFQDGTVANPAGLFKRGQSGNPRGRPKGSGRFRPGNFQSGTRAAAALFEENAEALAAQAIGLALAGDSVAVRFCLGRVLGARRGLPVALDLPALGGAADLAGAIAAIAAALNEGRVTPEEALALSQMLGGFPRPFAAASVARGPERDDGGAAMRARLTALLDRLAPFDQTRADQPAADQLATDQSGEPDASAPGSPG